MQAELAKLLGDGAVVATDAHLLTDMTRLPGRADAVVLLVPHSGPDYVRLAARARLLFDTVNRYRGLNAENVVAL